MATGVSWRTLATRLMSSTMERLRRPIISIIQKCQEKNAAGAYHILGNKNRRREVGGAPPRLSLMHRWVATPVAGHGRGFERGCEGREEGGEYRKSVLVKWRVLADLTPSMHCI
jgi:hypothetical protein